ncbi:MAG: hypothetical protein A2V70_01700 [Planctomycetes bacterium RBG_13_63_9]|nr:MAG: hypothetical protein A2V70_01700 [Planctomycetes bacterium RBG_13_63_9]
MIANLWKRFARCRCSAPHLCRTDHRRRRLALEALEQRRLLAAATFAIQPYLQDPTDGSVVIMWETDQNCASAYNYVDYRVTGGGAFTSVNGDQNDDAKIAEIEIASLTANTTYEFRVRSSTNGTAPWGYSPSDTTTYSFKTFPSPSDPPDHLRFVAYGDSRSNDDWHESVVDDIVQQMGTDFPGFALHVGDLVNSGQGNRVDWKNEYFTPADDLLTGDVWADSSSRPAVPVMTVNGNHEYSPNPGSGTHWYAKYMHSPDEGDDGENYFAFTYGNARVIGLNTCNGADSYVSYSYAPPYMSAQYTQYHQQYDWLVEQLESSDYQNADWHVVYLHHPGYTCTSTGHGESYVTNSVITQLAPLFGEYGVDLVFYGHNHCYERYLSPDDLNGVNYILTGGGGAPGHKSATDSQPPIRIAGLFRSIDESDTDRHLHHTTVDIDIPNRTLSFQALALDKSIGTQGVFDTLSLSKDYTFRDGVLTVYGKTSSSSIAIASVTEAGDGKKFVTVNEKRVAGVETSHVTEIIVNGSSIGETIDLSAVTTTNGFTTTLNGNVRISGGAGDDTITGSAFGDIYVFSGSELGSDSINLASGVCYLQDDDTILVAPDSVATLNDDLELDNSAAYDTELQWVLNGSGNSTQLLTGLIDVAGDVDLDGTLSLRGLDRTLDESHWAVDETKIIQAAGQAGISGTFATVNTDEDEIHDGVFWTLTYNTHDVAVDVLQAYGGDTDGDRDVDFADFNNLANNYTGANPPPPAPPYDKDWTQGDFDADGDVDFADFNTLANHYTGVGGDYTGGSRDGGGGGGEEIREDAGGDDGGLRVGAGQAELWVDLSDGSVSLYGDDVGLNGISVVSASGSLEPAYFYYPEDPEDPIPLTYPFYNGIIYTEEQMDLGNVGKVYFNEGGQERPVYWTFDTEGTQDLVFYYGTSEGTFQGDVVYYGERDSGGGGGSAPEFDAASMPDWINELDPRLLDELARFVADRESSANTPRTAAVDQLLELLLTYPA